MGNKCWTLKDVELVPNCIWEVLPSSWLYSLENRSSFTLLIWHRYLVLVMPLIKLRWRIWSDLSAPLYQPGWEWQCGWCHVPCIHLCTKQVCCKYHKSYGQSTRTSLELQTWQEHSPAQAWWCLVHLLGSWSPNWGLLRRLHLWADLSASMDFHKLLWRCSFNNCWSMVIINKVISLLFAIKLICLHSFNR